MFLAKKRSEVVAEMQKRGIPLSNEIVSLESQDARSVRYFSQLKDRITAQSGAGDLTPQVSESVPVSDPEKDLRWGG